MEDAEAGRAKPDDADWSARRVERVDWLLGSGAVADCATYRVVGGQREAFDALRAFSAANLEPVAVDLAGLHASMRDSFLDFLESTGLIVVEWLGPDVVLLTASGRGDGGAGVREPARPHPPTGHLAAEAPIER